jgi:hypothetical protein
MSFIAGVLQMAWNKNGSFSADLTTLSEKQSGEA